MSKIYPSLLLPVLLSAESARKLQVFMICIGFYAFRVFLLILIGVTDPLNGFKLSRKYIILHLDRLNKYLTIIKLVNLIIKEVYKDPKVFTMARISCQRKFKGIKYMHKDYTIQ